MISSIKIFYCVRWEHGAEINWRKNLRFIDNLWYIIIHINTNTHKHENNFSSHVTTNEKQRLFSSITFRDGQVKSNLTWLDSSQVKNDSTWLDLVFVTNDLTWLDLWKRLTCPSLITSTFLKLIDVARFKEKMNQ
jgi:hypothetical protein